jgi:hypothetical protein
MVYREMNPTLVKIHNTIWISKLDIGLADSHWLPARWRSSWTKPIPTCGMATTMPWKSPIAWGWRIPTGWCAWDRYTTTRWKRLRGLGRSWGRFLRGRLIPAFLFTSNNAYPPDMAPTTRRGSMPAATASGRGSVVGSCDKSSPQAKNRMKGRRCMLTWSRIVPRSIGYWTSNASTTANRVAGPYTSSST